jgi:DNA-binding transcriptional LysR family regulator
VLLRARLEALFRVAGLEPPPARIEADSISFIAAVLRDSDMLSFATSQVLRSEMGGVAPLPIPGLTMRRSAGILFRSTLGLAPATRAFIAALEQRAREIGTN